jgi:hypothetical protein
MPTLQNSTVETISILQPNAIVIYKSFPRKAREQTEAEIANLEKGKSGAYNGYLSPATSRKIKKFLGAWLTALEFNIKRDGDGARIQNKYFPTFVTLTLPAEQFHTDNQVKRDMLNRLIITLKNKFLIKEYFWRAEPQANGNIHFHLIVDKYIPWASLRKEWNKILSDTGYIEIYRQNQNNFHAGGFRVRKDLLPKWSEEKQFQAYQEGISNNWSNPNTTDIHRINKVKSLAAYVVKYCCKADTSRRKITGRIWGSSDGLRNLKYYSDVLAVSDNFQDRQNPEIAEYLNQVEANVTQEDIYQDEFITVIKLKDGQEAFLKRFAPNIYNQYRKYYRQILRDLYQPPIFNNIPEATLKITMRDPSVGNNVVKQFVFQGEIPF